jgi:hypothetical protein
MPMQRALYPADWERISASIRARAGNRCEWPGCGLENGETVQGRRGPYKVVLTVAHLDHNPANCDADNLRAWCQPHHLRYDARHHARNAAKTRRHKQVTAGQVALFPDEYEGDQS